MQRAKPHPSKFLPAACARTRHLCQPSSLGLARRSSELLHVLSLPGPIELDTISAANWSLRRSGLIDLDHPKARGLRDGLEPIDIYFHSIHHPERGAFIVDTGVERALRDDRKHAAMRGFIAYFAHLERLQIKVVLSDWLAAKPIAGVMLTHLHFDHVWGLPDVPQGTPIYAGAGEANARAFRNLATRAIVDRSLAGHDAINEWQFQPDPDGRFDGLIDVFGDGSFWAILVPGHTPGSTAYLARTRSGPVLLTGDTCHTAWGWEHGVTPGRFTTDRRANARSLATLRRLVEEHPRIDVRLGHQWLRKAM